MQDTAIYVANSTVLRVAIKTASDTRKTLDITSLCRVLDDPSEAFETSSAHIR